MLGCLFIRASPAEDCTPSAHLSEIAAGVYARQGKHAVVFEDVDIANVGFVVGDRCVAVIDTGGSVAEGRALHCAIKHTTPLPVCFVINTHAHPDHTLGNLAFQSDNVVFIGHAKLPRALALLGTIYLQRASAQAGQHLGPEHIVAPDRTVQETTDLDLGDRILRVTAHAPAHTDHDLSVYDEKTGTLWTGDLVFMEHLPVIDGSINGWLEVLGALRRAPATRVVPGHGPVQAHWPVAGDDTVRYLSALREEIRVRIAQGGDLRGAQEHVGYGERSNWVLFDHHHKRNVATAFNELEWED